MRQEAAALLNDAHLISLDHDLNPDRPGDPDPGTGREVAEWLANLRPRCPILIHSANTNAAWGMYNVLSEAKCHVEVLPHLNDTGWVGRSWVPVARRLVATFAPVSHLDRKQDDWLIEALSRPSADRFRSLEQEIDRWSSEVQAMAFFRIAIGWNESYAHHRAGKYLADWVPRLPYSCEQAVRAIAAGSLISGNRALIFYMVTQYGKPAIQKCIAQLMVEEYDGKLPPGLGVIDYDLRSHWLMKYSGAWSDWRDETQ